MRYNKIFKQSYSMNVSVQTFALQLKKQGQTQIIHYALIKSDKHVFSLSPVEVAQAKDGLYQKALPSLS